LIVSIENFTSINIYVYVDFIGIFVNVSSNRGALRPSNAKRLYTDEKSTDI